jgi:hypothetical protein
MLEYRMLVFTRLCALFAPPFHTPSIELLI